MGLNILYTVLSYPPAIGGGQAAVHRIAKEMLQRGHQARVISQWSTQRDSYVLGSTVFCGPCKSYSWEGVPVHRLGFHCGTRLRMAPWAAAYRALRDASTRRISALMEPYYEAAAGQPDLVHVARMGAEFLVVAALHFARRRNVPFVLTPYHHPCWDGPQPGAYDAIYREADAVIALTTHEAQTLVARKGVEADRVHVTGAGPALAEEFSVERFRRTYGIAGPYVLFLGRLARYKGYMALMRAAPQVWRQFPDVTFVFAGLRNLRSGITFMSVHDRRIRSIGAVDQKSKTAALAGCELLCVPSTQESFGIVFCEAWTLGKPVIGGRIGPVASVIEDGKDGLLSSQDPDELAEKIRWLLARPSAAAAMGERGRRKVLERYTWPRLAEQTLGVYRSVL